MAISDHPVLPDLIDPDPPRLRQDAPRRGKPYLWVTHLAGYLAGDRMCEYSLWYRSHFDYHKRLLTFGDLTQWKLNHTRAVRERRDALRAKGYTVYTEDQNKFTYVGKVLIVGGKPDLLAVKDDDERAYVVDCKTGADRDSDFYQVALYCALAPPVLPLLDNKIVTGIVDYGDHRRIVKTSEVEAILPEIGDAVKRIAALVPPETTPSVHECSRCDIDSCEDRLDGPRENQAEVAGALF